MTDSPVPPPAPTSTAAEVPAATKTKPHVLAIIALIAAVVGFVFACIPGALIVGWILLPIAFVLSLVALFLKGSKWPAIVGLIVAIVGTIVGFVVFFAVAANAVDEAFGDGGTSVTQPSASPEEAEAAAPDPDAAENFTVTINGATQATDYEGKPALVVSFTFTNNSDSDASFLTSVSAKAFQDGVELGTAILTDETVDASNLLKDIKPGASLEVQEAFSLTSTTDVLVEVADLFNFDDTLIATKTFTVQ